MENIFNIISIFFKFKTFFLEFFSYFLKILNILWIYYFFEIWYLFLLLLLICRYRIHLREFLFRKGSTCKSWWLVWGLWKIWYRWLPILRLRIYRSRGFKSCRWWKIWYRIYWSGSYSRRHKKVRIALSIPFQYSYKAQNY